MKKKIQEINLRIEDAHRGRWFDFLLNREKERQVGIFNMKDDYAIAVSESMIPYILLGLNAMKIEFETHEKAKEKSEFKNKFNEEIHEHVYDVYANDIIDVVFFRKKSGRDSIITIDWTSICLSKKMVEEWIAGLTKAQKMLSGDNF